MKKFIIKKAGKRGKGLFAKTNIKKGEIVVRKNLTKFKSYSRKEIDKNSKLQSDHCDYVGRGRYVIDTSPVSFINHSCNPNCYFAYKTISVGAVVALRDIRKGEEITVDYGVNAMDQFDKNEFVLNCHCGSKDCRKRISMDFFKQPIKIQKKYYKYLPPSIKRRYRKRLMKLRFLNL